MFRGLGVWVWGLGFWEITMHPPGTAGALILGTPTMGLSLVLC